MPRGSASREELAGRLLARSLEQTMSDCRALGFAQKTLLPAACALPVDALVAPQSARRGGGTVCSHRELAAFPGNFWTFQSNSQSLVTSLENNL